MRLSLTLMIGLASISACATAASVSDSAIRTASLNRIQATPFSDMVSETECRERLPQIFGIHKETLEVQAGVQVRQTYRCQGPNIVATVNLTNLNPHSVYCAAIADSVETGTWVGPQGRAVYAYKFQFDANLQCDAYG